MFWLKYIHKLAPGWLLQEFGKRFIYGSFSQFDSFTQLARDSRKTALILEEECGNDAILLKGNEFGLPKYNIETNAQYRARIERAWEIFSYVGTAHGVNLLLSLVFQSDSFTITEDKPNARFSVRWNQPNEIPLITPSEQTAALTTVAIIRDCIFRMKGSGPICNSIQIERFDGVIFHWVGC